MYKRVLLKISGEACSSKTATFDSEFLNELALELKKVINNGTQVAIVVGGGNIMRGKFASQLGLSRMEADKMGMLATVINALAIKSACQSNGLEAVVQSSIEMNRVCDIVDYQKAIDHLEKGHVVIYGGGTGNPYFSTDSAAALRACEISAQAILMAKNGVDGVYDSDPAYESVKKYVMTKQTISVSGLQRRFSFGFPRAAKLIDCLQQDGIISESKGSKPREVLIRSNESEK